MLHAFPLVWDSGASLSLSLLVKWDLVSTIFIADTYHDGGTSACDKDVFLSVNFDIVLCDYGDIAIVIYFADAHEEFFV